MKRPLVGLALAFGAGIWLASSFWISISSLLAVLVALFFAAILLRRFQKFAELLMLGIAFCAGALHFSAKTHVLPANHIANLLSASVANAKFRGVVLDDLRDDVDKPTLPRAKFVVCLTEFYDEPAEIWRATSGKILLWQSARRAEERVPLRYGDEIQFECLLRPSPRPTNPHQFNYARWLERRGIVLNGVVRRRDSLEILRRDRGNPVVALAHACRQRLDRALEFGLDGEAAGAAGVLAGMVLGERRTIPAETYADFQRTGVFHVFAISGLHVGLVTAMVVMLLNVLRLPQRWCALAAIPVLILYVIATGARPGAVRALVMACVFLLSWAFVRPLDALNSLAAAAMLILIFDPNQLFDGGFQLSFAVVTAILVLTPRFEKFFIARLQPDPFLPHSLVPKWRRKAQIPMVWSARLLSVSLAAWLGLLPLMAYYFHLFAPIAILANVVVVPLLGLVLSFGVMSVATFLWWPWATEMFNNANYFLLSAMMKAVGGLADVPWGHQFVPSPPVWVACAFYVAGALVLNRRWKISWRAAGVGAVTPLLAVGVWSHAWHDNAVELTVLEMNDGDAIFVNLPGNSHDLLLDGGSAWRGRTVVEPFLRGEGVDKLWAVVATRASAGRVGGLLHVHDKIPVAQAMCGGFGSRSSYYRQWQNRVREKQIPHKILRAGDEFEPQTGVKFRVLHPPRRASSTRGDDNSLVLLLEFGATRVLLASDIGETVERALAKSGENLRADVLLKGFHGRETSGTDEFLDAVRPKVVVMNIGARPSRKLPPPDLLERLDRRKILLMRTDGSGAIVIRLTQNGVAIRTCLAPDQPLILKPST
jgi:competence protein ComEC